MENVARHLQVRAISLHQSGDDGDTFARSAYNRYYYAMFLSVRSCLSGLNAAWSRLPHSNYPEVLENTVQKKINDGRRRAQKISDQKLLRICSQGLNAARNLADIMKAGYSIRVISDYQPEIRVSFDSSDRFNLNGVDITVAHQWPQQAKVFGVLIAQAWRQIDV